MLFFVASAFATEVVPAKPAAHAARAMVGLGTVQAEECSGFEVGFDGMVELGAGVELGLRVPYVMSSDPGRSLSASDVAIGLSGASMTQPFELRFGVEVNLPLYEVGEGATLLSADGRSAPGDGSVDVELSAGVEKRAGPISFAAQGAYRHRFADYADGVPWRADLKVHAGSMEIGADVGGHQALWADANTREWVRVGGSLAYVGMAPLRVEVYGGYLPWTEAMPAGWGAGLAIGAEINPLR